MTLLSEWNALSARIHNLKSASGLYLNTQTPTFSSHTQIIGPLIDNIDRLRGEGDRFSQRHRMFLQESAQASIDHFLRWHPTEATESATYYTLLERIIALCSFETEFTHLLSSHDVAIKRITERAFLHLSRSLVVDSQLKQRWQAAFAEREESIEKLGGVHLLQHGIWGFKAHAEGERTDLLLSEPITDINMVERASEGLVLTEWKRCRSHDNANELWGNALNQAYLYGAGCLAATELRGTRYLVLVSENRIREPSDIVKEGICYRHINVAIDPSTPSKERVTMVSPGQAEPIEVYVT